MDTINEIIDRISERKFAFAVAFFIVFTISYGVLAALDWLPEPKTDAAEVEVSTEAATTVATEEEIVTESEVAPVATPIRDNLPRTITIDALDKVVTVLNPQSRAIADLDAALLSGVVRHPDSATLDDDGNIFILGHSSYLPNVLNRNYQAFNGVQNLRWGDTIRLTSNDTEYVYRVEKVYQARASALTVPVAGTGKMLTLATCNSFGSTDDRYIVEARLVSETVLQYEV